MTARMIDPSMLMGTKVATVAGAAGAITPTGDAGSSGLTFIEQGTPLTRLNYYDGKFLRASDLQGEQAYFRELVALSNQAGGAGVVYGLDLTLAAGDQLTLSAGLGIGPGGRVLYLPTDATFSIQKLIDATAQVATTRIPLAGGSAAFADCIGDTVAQPTDPVRGLDLYLITVCYAEGLCGEEDVYGKLCEEACVTSTDRPYRVEGVVVRATPLVLDTTHWTWKAFTPSAIHQRSIIASAYYESERTSPAHQSLITADGLRSGAWCLGAKHEAGCGVTVGVLARSGRTTLFLDEWTARRERIDAPARSYWAWKMMMRPWSVFLAQILQFQCQLHEVLATAVDPGAGGDQCSEHEAVLTQVGAYLTNLRAQYQKNPPADNATLAYFDRGIVGLSNLSDSVNNALVKVAKGASDRVLIRGGIVELPPAGYLPVVAKSSVTVNDQVRALLGDGVDLRFCIVHPDYVAHALETAQHMNRISLIDGLDDPGKKPKVDILVPDGLVTTDTQAKDRIFDASVRVGLAEAKDVMAFRGAARTQTLDDGGEAFHLAAIGPAGSPFAIFVAALTQLKSGEALVGGLTKKVVETPIDFTDKFVASTQTVSDSLRRMQFDRVNMAGAFYRAETQRTDATLALGKYLGKTSPGVDGAWLTMQTDMPLSALGASSPTAHISGRLVVGDVQRAVLTGAEVLVSGTASFVGEVDTGTGGGRRIDANLALTITVASIKEENATELETIMARRIVQPVSMTFADDGSVGAVEAVFTGRVPIGRLRITASWGRPAGSIRLQVFTLSATGSNAQQLVDVVLDEDPDVMNDTNRSHGYATTGIAIVQSVLQTEDSVEQDALAALFAPLGGTSELAIQAVNDWVLFHRRRMRQCEAAPVMPVEPPRSYLVTELTATTPTDAANMYRKILYESDPQAAASVRSPGVELKRLVLQRRELIVDFAGGSTTMRNNPSDVALDWKTLFAPGPTLAYAIVARPNADRTTELARLGNVESAISSVTDVSNIVESTYVRSVPADLSDPATDGSMIFITVTAAECQHVVAMTANVWDTVKKQLLTAKSVGDVTTALKGTPGNFAPPLDLGQVNFSAGTSTSPDQTLTALKDVVQTKFGSDVKGVQVVAWLPKNDSSAATHLDQANAIGTEAAGSIPLMNATSATSIVNQTLDPGSVKFNSITCPAFTFLIISAFIIQ